MWEKNCHIWYWNCKIWGWNCQMWEKSKGTTQCNKRTVTCDKNRPDVMLVLLNMTIEPSNLRRKKKKKKKEPLYVIKELSNVILKSSNVRNK